MSFWGTLGKTLLGAGSAVAAPFTGGASLAIPGLLGGIGAAAGGAAKGAEDERLSGANYGLTRDKLNLDAGALNERAIQDRAALELDRQKAQREAQSDAYMKAIRGALAQNFRPASRPSGVPTISFMGNGIGASGRANAAELERQATIALLESGKPLQALDARTPLTLSSPEEMKKASTFEKLAGILGLGATAVGTALAPKGTAR